MATPKRGTERATIDCCMVVATTEETSPRCIGITSGTKIAVEPQVETTEAVKLIIKGTLKAQKPEKRTLTGHTITLTDNLTILELIEILQGGTVTRNEAGEIISYEPPASGVDYDPVKFTLDVYSAQMAGSDVIGYEKTIYPGCAGQPAGLNSEDDVFRATEYTINSAPGNGEAPYKIEYVDTLPVIGQEIGSLSITSTAGATTGKTVLTVTPNKSSGNTYKYKTAASVALPAYDDSCVTGYTDWNGTDEITATTGQKVLVVECDSSNKAKKAGIATVTSKA
nr:MAG TPA: S-layer protein [Caudoviricetes sp.]